MNARSIPNAVWLAVLGSLVVAASSCTTAPTRPNGPRSVNLAAQTKPNRPSERDEAVRRFEEDRDRAEYQAAEARWGAGDIAGCRQRLDRLLARRPDYSDARDLQQFLATHGDRSAIPAGFSAPAGDDSPPVPAAPERAADLVRRGEEAIAAGSPSAALGYFRDAMALGPGNPQIAVSAAIAAMRHDRPDLAADLLQHSIDRIGGSVSARQTLAVALYRRGDFATARTALQQAIALDRSNALSHFLMGSTLAKLGESSLAQQYFRQAATLDPRYAAP